jgi:hypothetical protein
MAETALMTPARAHLLIGTYIAVVLSAGAVTLLRGFREFPDLWSYLRKSPKREGEVIRTS